MIEPILANSVQLKGHLDITKRVSHISYETDLLNGLGNVVLVQDLKNLGGSSRANLLDDPVNAIVDGDFVAASAR